MDNMEINGPTINTTPSVISTIPQTLAPGIIDIEEKILGYQNYDSMTRNQFISEKEDKEERLSFLKKANISDGVAIRKTKYEIAKLAFDIESSKQVCLTALSMRIQSVSYEELEIIRKQRCIKFYNSEVSPLVTRLQELNSKLKKIQEDIDEAYNNWKQTESEEKKRELAEKAERLNEDSTNCEKERHEIEKQIEQRKEELVKLQRATTEEIKKDLMKKLEEIKGKNVEKRKNNILSFIPANIPFDSIDRISALIARYSELEAQKNSAKIDLTEEEDIELFNSSISTILSNNVIRQNNPQQCSIKVTGVLAEEIKNEYSKFKAYYERIFVKLMNQGCLEVFYSQDDTINNNKSNPDTEEKKKMDILYDILRFETADRDPDIEGDFCELNARMDQFISDSEPCFLRPSVLQKTINRKNKESYEQQASYLDEKFKKFILWLSNNLKIPKLDEWICKMKQGITDNNLKQEVMEEAKKKLGLLKVLSEKLRICYLEKIQPTKKEQEEIANRIYEEIKLYANQYSIANKSYEIPIVENYTDRAAILRTIAAAQQGYKVEDSSIREDVKQGQINEINLVRQSMDQIESDYEKTQGFVESGPRYK